MSKKDRDPNGNEIRFYEEEHEYFVNNTKYTSVTTFLSKFFPKFDSDKVAFFVARKTGRDKEDVLKEWAENRDNACEYGTNVHFYAECLINSQKDEKIVFPVATSDREKDAFILVEEMIEGLGKKYDFLDTEKIVFLNKYQLAGTIDLILRNKETGEICLLDWKTNNKKIGIPTPYEKAALEPIDYMTDGLLDKYSLQLNLYKRMLEEGGYYKEIGGMFLCQILDGECHIIKVPDCSESISTVLKYREEELKPNLDIDFL